MLRDITLGQYYQGSSLIHRLDPRFKVIATLIYLIAMFIVDSFIGMGICFLGIMAVIAVSKVPVSFIMRGMKPIFFILLLTFILNLFMTRGEPLFQWWIFKVSREGLIMATFVAIRLILLIIGSSVLTLTTKPISLTDGMESLLKPFKVVGLPAHEIAMMMSIALRFIPTLIEETDKIMKAQQSRGADFESGNIFQRGKALIPILVPLFISAIQIAKDLALAMESRCYRGGEGRTRMKPMRLARIDYIGMIFLGIFLIIVICDRFVY